MAKEDAIAAAGIRYQLMHLPYFQSAVGPVNALRERNVRGAVTRSIQVPLHQQTEVEDVRMFQECEHTPIVNAPI